MATIYARFFNQFQFKYYTVFSARFDKQDEDSQALDETEFFIKLNKNHNLTETDIDNIDIKCPLEHQIQRQEMKKSSWRFDKINSMTISFYRIGEGELNGSCYVKIPIRSSALLSIVSCIVFSQDDDKICFIWSIIAKFFPIIDPKMGIPQEFKIIDINLRK